MGFSLNLNRQDFQIGAEGSIKQIQPSAEQSPEKRIEGMLKALDEAAQSYKKKQFSKAAVEKLADLAVDVITFAEKQGVILTPENFKTIAFFIEAGKTASTAQKHIRKYDDLNARYHEIIALHTQKQISDESALNHLTNLSKHLQAPGQSLPMEDRALLSKIKNYMSRLHDTIDNEKKLRSAPEYIEGEVSKEGAKSLLEDMPDGTWLLRYDDVAKRVVVTQKDGDALHEELARSVDEMFNKFSFGMNAKVIYSTKAEPSTAELEALLHKPTLAEDYLTLTTPTPDAKPPLEEIEDFPGASAPLRYSSSSPPSSPASSPLHVDADVEEVEGQQEIENFPSPSPSPSPSSTSPSVSPPSSPPTSPTSQD